MVSALGAITSLWATKYSLMLAVIISVYWSYRALCVLINPTIFISDNGKEIVFYRTAIGFVFHKKTMQLSDYYGIRNRVHWGHYRHCQTELVGRHGNFLPVRVELMSGTISDAAKDYKTYLAEKFGFEARPDIEHV